MRAYTVANALVYAGGNSYVNEPFAQHDLHIARGRIVDKPARNAPRIDLTGYAVFPALINAHDHLELNHYPRTKFREKYDNAHQWGEDVNDHLNDSLFRRLRAYPLWDRLFIGGLKNLLCGALTVAHHNPPHRELFSRDYPVRVLRRYGWSHSLHFSTDDEIVKAYHKTPKNAPFFIHLAEGTDEIAAGEYQRLKALGCVGTNTVMVHGVGLTNADIVDAAPRIRALVTCPTTNRYLLGKTATLDAWQAAGGTLWIGSDSRLTADGDLLDEINTLSQSGESCRDVIHRVHFEMEGKSEKADWIAIHADATMPLRRADLALVVRGGVPQIGDPDLMARFPDVPTVPAVLDGRPKAIHANLARQIRACKLQEPGLTVE